MDSMTCITFRAADDKLPGDVSRNWEQIETIIPKEHTHGVMLDPHDSSVYMIGLKVFLDSDRANFLLTLLHLVMDDRDNRPLIADAACRTMSVDHFKAHDNNRGSRDAPHLSMA
jgi:hypothetical protein